MSILTLDEILEVLQREDESLQIEAKRGSAIDKSVLQTISAFSNEMDLGGGYLILGAEAEGTPLFPGMKTYTLVGLSNPDQLQADLATQCRTALVPPVRPDIRTYTKDGKVLLVVFVPEAQPQDKPVYIKSQGLPRGAYRRIASTDQYCTEDDLEVFYQGRAHTTFDETPIPGTTLDDVDPSALASYRRDRANISPEASELTYSDEDLLQALAATARHKGEVCLTLAGLLLFGKESAQRRHVPMARVDYIVVPGQEWVPDPENRYQGIELRGPLLTLVHRVLNQVLGDIKRVPILRGTELHRTETPIVPQTVLREAIVNAVMHRSYRTRSPIQIIRYTNRIEFRNPGYSLVSDERLGEPGSITRNEKIAAVLHEVGLAETKGTGVRTMRRLMKEAQLTPPTFESDRERDAFLVLLLLHHLLGEEDLAWLKRFEAYHLDDSDALALLYLREVGAINNSVYRSLSSLDTLRASAKLRRLRELGLIDQKDKGAATHYVATEALTGMPSALSDMSGSLSDMSPALSDMLAGQPDMFPDMPEDLKAQVQALGRRTTPAELSRVILNLCRWRELEPQELAQIIGKSLNHLRETQVYPLLEKGLLLYRYPESPKHPKQAYRTAPEALDSLKDGE